MDDDAAFLNAIEAQPTDVTPRLIYADWLEEQGDPRAEYLRVEVELAGVIDDPDRTAALETRLLELSATIDPARLAPISKKYDVILQAVDPRATSTVFLSIRRELGLETGEIAGRIHSLPWTLQRGVAWHEAMNLRSRLLDGWPFGPFPFEIATIVLRASDRPTPRVRHPRAATRRSSRAR